MMRQKFLDNASFDALPCGYVMNKEIPSLTLASNYE